jgi:hypothetical protein
MDFESRYMTPTMSPRNARDSQVASRESAEQVVEAEAGDENHTNVRRY